ncbi:MAG: ribosomal-processing cysteine protease Prp [Lachnospiraceae bacterium]|nr:ribosomal-processing cysteine protease Prp [Lachnospiraceae bacterium]
MITFKVYKKSTGEIVGFDCTGHAGYAEAGYDIFCAAVSTLVINTVNSIDELTEDAFKVDSDEDKGILLRVDNPGDKTTLLLNSLVLGVEGIRRDNDGEYIEIVTEEV